MSELKLFEFEELPKHLEELPRPRKITIVKSSSGRWFLCFSLFEDLFTYNYPLKTSEKGRKVIAEMLNAEIKETNFAFFGVLTEPGSSYDRFYLYEKEGKVICVLLAMNSDSKRKEPTGCQFSFEISRPELIPETSIEHSCIVFHEDFN